jgi:pyridoxamine 5'-phosphate oxidase
MPAPADPIALFARSFERARRSPAADAADPTAVCLATADADGRPAARMVLLKGFDSRGFVFYTNYGSRKAGELAVNPRAALCFYWPAIGEQIRVEGTVEKVSDEESDAYFASRDRASQLGAWASRQSEPLTSRARLLGRLAKAEARFAVGAVPRPPFWGGFRLIPERIEIWRSRLHRLHERLLYRRDGDGWTSQRLYP